MDPLRFDERVAVITGAGRGLGRAHALLLASLGARVVVNDLGAELSGTGSDAGPAATVVDEIVAAGGKAAASTASVADEPGAAAIIDTAIDAFGRVDIVINNAGILTNDRFGQMPMDVLMRHLSVHVAGSFNVTQAAWPHLVENGYGRIVVTTSSALFGAPGLIGYATAKGALVGLARSLAQVGAGAGIKVNLLAPAAETRMVTDPETREKAGLPRIAADAPLEPTRGAAEVSPMVAVLAHQDCPVNGEIMSAGGGRLAHITISENAGLVAPGLSPEQVLERWGEITDTAGTVSPASTPAYIAHREARLAAGHG